MFKLKEIQEGNNWVVETWECHLTPLVIRLHYARRRTEQVDLSALFEQVLRSYSVNTKSEIHEYYGSNGRLHEVKIRSIGG